MSVDLTIYTPTEQAIIQYLLSKPAGTEITNNDAAGILRMTSAAANKLLVNLSESGVVIRNKQSHRISHRYRLDETLFSPVTTSDV